jgi:protein FRG1
MPVKPLTFKGDKKSKKRKHQSTTDGHQPTSREVAASSQPKHDGDDTWVTAELPTDIIGPIVLVLPSDTPSCIACDANGKVFSSELENLVEGDSATAEPHDVRQVWVASRVVGSEHTSFKGHHGWWVVYCLVF